MPSWKKIIVSGSSLSQLNNDAGYAKTGSSNTFNAAQTINGDLIVTGSITALQYIVSTSVIYITQSNYSGSTVFGNTLDDTHQFTGSVFITGSTTQIGTNNLLGNTTLSGSIIISGSLGTNNPTVKIYGDTQHNGYIRFDPVSTNIDTSVSASYIYVSGSTNDLYFSQNGAGYNNVTRLRWLEGNLYTGLLHGGLITSQSSTTYQVSSGSGIIVNLNASLQNDPYPTVQFLQWGNITNTIDALSASYDQQFVSVNSSATITAQGTPYTDGQYNTLIPIGVVVHQNHSTINAVQTFPSVGYGWKQRSYDFIKAFGPLKISGYTLAQSGSSVGGLVLSGGTAWVDGRNYIVDPTNPSYIVEASGIVTSKIYRYYQSGSNYQSEWGYDTNAGAGYTAIDPTQYSNAGTLTTLTNNNKWSIQRVYYFPNSATKALYIYYGNAQYDSQAAAVAALNTEPFNEAPNTTANAIFVGYMVLQKTADFTNTNTYAFYAGGLFRSSGTGGGGSSGGATALSGLTDVGITSAAQGDLLSYDTVTSKWINTKTLSGSYILSGSLNVSGSVTASLFGTSSWATNARNAGTIDIYSFGSNVDSYLLMSNVVATTGVAIGGDADLRYNASTNTLTAVNISATTLTGSLFGTASRAILADSASTALVNNINSANEHGVLFVPGTGIYNTLGASTTTFVYRPDNNPSLKLYSDSRLATFNLGDPNGQSATRGGILNVSGTINVYRGGVSGADNVLVLSSSSGPLMYVKDSYYSTTVPTFNVFAARSQVNISNPNALTVDGTGSVFMPQLSSSNQQHVVMFNSASGQLTYVTASSFGGGGGATFPYTGTAIITGSLIVTGSVTITGSIRSTLGFTGSLFGTASFATTASHALNVLSPGGSSTQLQYNNNGVFSGVSGLTFNAGLNTVFATNISATGSFTGSFNGSILATGSLFGTSSFATRALTASFAENILARGSNTQLQFNSASVLSGSNNLSFDYTTNTLLITGSVITLQSTSPFADIDTKNGYLYGNNVSNTNRIVTIDYGNNRLLYDRSGNLSINWQGRTLYDIAGNSALDYSYTTLANGVRLYGTSSYALTASIAGFASTSSYTLNSGTVVTQSFSSLSTWTFTHNLNRREVAVAVFDSSYNQIIPQTLNLTDANTATITFPTAVSGFAVATFGGATTNYLFQSATIDNINVGTTSTEIYNYMVRAQELEQSKHSTINIYNSINFI